MFNNGKDETSFKVTNGTGNTTRFVYVSGKMPSLLNARLDLVLDPTKPGVPYISRASHDEELRRKAADMGAEKKKYSALEETAKQQQGRLKDLEPRAIKAEQALAAAQTEHHSEYDRLFQENVAYLREMGELKDESLALQKEAVLSAALTNYLYAVAIESGANLPDLAKIVLQFSRQGGANDKTQAGINPLAIVQLDEDAAAKELATDLYNAALYVMGSKVYAAFGMNGTDPDVQTTKLRAYFDRVLRQHGKSEGYFRSQEVGKKPEQGLELYVMGTVAKCGIGAYSDQGDGATDAFFNSVFTLMYAASEGIARIPEENERYAPCFNNAVVIGDRGERQLTEIFQQNKS